MTLIKMTLIDALLNIQHDPSWGIWAELNEEGKLEEDSRARYGERRFEQGGLSDDWVYVCNGEQIGNWLTEWLGEHPNSEDASVLDSFWIDEYLDQVQQAIESDDVAEEPESDIAPPNCPHCGAHVEPDDSVCWDCGGTIYNC